MTIELTDDGTMDTVLRCTECGEEFRFNYDPGMMAEADEAAADSEFDRHRYDAWVESCIEEITEEHECDFNAERDADEQD